MQHLEMMKELFSEYYKWNPKRIGFFGNMISSIIRSRSVNMQKVAENIEGEAKTESNYRRIQRIFKDQKIDFDMTARLLSTVLPDDEKWTLSMDRTNWKLGKSNANLLVLAVAYKGMAIPLLWTFLTKEETLNDKTVSIGKRGNSNFQERKDLMQKFINLFGVDRINAFTADREFIGKEWFEWLNENNIPFVIRIRNNSLINDTHLDSRNVNELFQHVRKNEFCAFGRTKIFDTEVHLGGIKASKSDEALIVVSNQKMDKTTIASYQKRWEIETLFGALKSKGFNFEESKISEEAKVEKLMAFLSISFVWSVVAGDYRESIKPITYKKREISNEEPLQIWFGMAQKRISQFNNKKEGIFLVA